MPDFAPPTTLETVLARVVHAGWQAAVLALAGLRRERELACDAAVLRHLGGQEARRYGHVLLAVAQRLSVSAPLPGAVGAFGKDRSLVR